MAPVVTALRRVTFVSAAQPPLNAMAIGAPRSTDDTDGGMASAASLGASSKAPVLTVTRLLELELELEASRSYRDWTNCGQPKHFKTHWVLLGDVNYHLDPGVDSTRLTVLMREHS